MNGKPNFLFIITDQHRADWLGCMGHPVVKTPNIDAIAAQGTKFTDFHVASPVCMPNRAALMTGRMPGVNGLRYNGCVLPDRANTFADVLLADGYSTALIGKSHHQPFSDVAPFHGPAPKGRLIEEAWKPDGDDYGKEQPERYAGTDRYDIPTPYYGFDHVDLVTGHGDQCGGHYEQWFRAACPDWRALRDPANEVAHTYGCPQAYRTPIPEELYPTTWIADRAIDYLNTQDGQTDPFFAFVSFPDPHHPFNPPGKYWDMYSPDDFDLPLPYSAHKNPTPGMAYLNGRHEQGLGAETKQSSFCADPQHLKEAMALTAGMITMIDDQIGRIITTLKETGLFDNTVIIFTSDHGDYLGDFGMLLKGPLPFRSITRVPMIWSDPSSRESQTCEALASTLDISATVLERAGLVPYNGIQGQSFLSCIGGAESHRDALYVEHNDALPRVGFSTAARVRTLITKDHRLTCYKGQDWGELYDLRADPYETRNLWDDPVFASQKAHLSLRLIDHLADQMDTSPLSNRLA